MFVTTGLRIESFFCNISSNDCHHVESVATLLQVTVNGKTVKAVQGQRLRDAVAAARAKIEYGCEKVRLYYMLKKGTKGCKIAVNYRGMSRLQPSM